MKKKSYKITFCLGSGYSGVGTMHTPHFVESVIKKWMIERINKKQPTINGFLQFGKLFFPARGRRGDGAAITVTPTGVYVGDLSSASDAKRSDKEVRETLISLASRIKDKLKQDRVYIIYKDDNWFVE